MRNFRKIEKWAASVAFTCAHAHSKNILDMSDSLGTSSGCLIQDLHCLSFIVRSE